MKKPWRIAGSGVIGLLIIAWIVAAISAAREPEYGGKKLTQWLEELRRPRPPSPMARTNAMIAIRHMGTNAVPYLVAMLHGRDSVLKTKCRDLLSRQRWINFHFRDNYLRHKADRGQNNLLIIDFDIVKAFSAKCQSSLLKQEHEVLRLAPQDGQL